MVEKWSNTKYLCPVFLLFGFLLPDEDAQPDILFCFFFPPGFLTFQIPYVHFSEQDFSSSHDAVGKTPPPPSLSAGDSWYKWYGEIIPDETEVAKVKKIYADYLK